MTTELFITRPLIICVIKFHNTLYYWIHSTYIIYGENTFNINHAQRYIILGG